jgi:hypothetical protein
MLGEHNGLSSKRISIKHGIEEAMESHPQWLEGSQWDIEKMKRKYHELSYPKKNKMSQGQRMSQILWLVSLLGGWKNTWPI